MKQRHVNVLSISCSNPAGWGGIQADLKVFGALGVYGMTAVTTIMAQNESGKTDECVVDMHKLSGPFVAQQIDYVFRNFDIHAVKIGLLGNCSIVEEVAMILQKYNPANVVLDPVLISHNGTRLSDDLVLGPMISHLFPLASVVTPNMAEAMAITGMTDNENNILAYGCVKMGARAVFLKTGEGNSPGTYRDVLLTDKCEQVYDHARIDTPNVHGAGCALSSALAVFLARGYDVVEACRLAKEYVTAALVTGIAEQNGQLVGKSPDHGSVNFFLI